MSAVLPTSTFATHGPKTRLLTPKAWTGVLAALGLVLVPVLNLSVPAGSAFHLSDYAVQLASGLRGVIVEQPDDAPLRAARKLLDEVDRRLVRAEHEDGLALAQLRA